MYVEMCLEHCMHMSQYDLPHTWLCDLVNCVNYVIGELCELMWCCVLDIFAWWYLYTWDDVMELLIMWWLENDVMIYWRRYSCDVSILGMMNMYIGMIYLKT